MCSSDLTLVIFSSDNGPARGKSSAPLELTYDSATGLGYGLGAAKGTTGGRREHKGSLREGGIGVPFIVRWPGHTPAGKVDDTTFISAVDLLPTFCELAQASLPVEYRPDGISQVEALNGLKSPLRSKPLFWRMPQNQWSFSVLHQQWKLLANKDFTKFELFDLVVDPLEAKEVSAGHPDVSARLLSMLKEWENSLPLSPAGKVFSSLRAKALP